ncbi:MAG: DNA gyrase subunit B, partial [Alphaproteobacteria bacterium]|nr:DNA gyrase subunit B [Alphaproteobacteria bacterium]
LLLTFFYRQMPQLIEAGHLFIAQPPLYKIARGKSEVYLKDEAGLESYLIDSGIKDVVLELHDGTQRAGEDLKALVERASRVRGLLDSIPSRYYQPLIEQLAIAGAINPDLLQDRDTAQQVADYVAGRMTVISEEGDGEWFGEPSDQGGLNFVRDNRGVPESYPIDMRLLDSAEARALDDMAAELQEVYAKPAILKNKDKETRIASPSELLNAILGLGRQGMSVQRYKGLGEMNPNQLWETTLDPDARHFLQVRISQADTADEMFSKLMGDIVEPRREFIQANALDVVNLDV